MKRITRGNGEPELVVVGSLHGDEPAGKNAIQRLLEENHDFRKPVKFIIANEKALEKDERYVDCDLNRSFPGKKNSVHHEDRLAVKITGEIKGKSVLDLHTTHSTEEPFATMEDTADDSMDFISSANVENAVYFPEDSGTMIHQAETGIIVETGPQGTEQAVEDAYKVLRNFLACQGVIDGECKRSDPQLFKHVETVEEDWKFEAENFQRVEEGEVYATRGTEKLEADEAFYPVLMSTNGYSGKLGYKAEKL